MASTLFPFTYFLKGQVLKQNNLKQEKSTYNTGACISALMHSSLFLNTLKLFPPPFYPMSSIQKA